MRLPMNSTCSFPLNHPIPPFHLESRSQLSSHGIPMNLPDDFQFSQGSLQDFVDCRRRFYLRCLLRLRWPAVQSEPMLEHERYLQQGSDFHRLAQQALVGLPVERLSASLVGEDLSHWWENFLDFLPGLTGGTSLEIYPEISLTAPSEIPAW